MPVNKKNIISGGVLLLLLGVTFYALLRGQQLSQIFVLLGRIKPGWILVGFGFMLVFVGFEAMSTKLVLTRLGHKVKYLRCLGYSFVGFYFGSITPATSGGEPAQIYCMSKDGIPAAHGALDMMLLGVGYQVISLLYAAVALLVYPHLLNEMGTGLGLLLIYGTAVMVTITSGMLLFMFRPSTAQSLSVHVLNLLAKLRLLKNRDKAERGLSRHMNDYQAGASCIRSNPSLAIGLFFFTLVQLTGMFAVPFAVYQAFGLTGHGAFEIICAQALLNLAVSMLPVPGAVGVTEGGLVRFFTVFFGAELVTPAVLMSRGVSFYAALVISASVTVLVHLLARGRAQRRALQNA